MKLAATVLWKQGFDTLRFTHHGDGWDQFGRRMDHYRAEVGLLTRSIVIQGDDETKKEQFGAQVVMSNGKDTGISNDLEARFSNVETRLGGQGPLGDVLVPQSRTR